MQPFGSTVLRLSLAAVFLVHGIEKLFGLWGGGLTATADFITSIGLGPAYPLAIASAAAELAAGILLVAGAYTLWVALLLTVGRIAVFYNFLATSTSLTRATSVGRNEFELSILLIGALIALMLTGPGALSIDERRARTAESDAAARARLRAGKV